MKNGLFILFGIVALFACTKPSALEQALRLAKENRAELEKVLDHYRRNPTDSLKYKAAVFLIENMPIHYYIRENPEWYDLMDSLNCSNLTEKEVYATFDSLKKIVTVSPATVFPDIRTLSSGFLIQHIDKSFDNWLNTAWKDNITFADFCEYILPYLVLTEKREPWIDYYRNKYLPYISGYLHDPKDPAGLVKLCDMLNDSLLKVYPMGIRSETISVYPPLQVDHIRSGGCGDYVARTIFLLRSLAIPISSCFAPQWIGYHQSHSWNILYYNGKYYPFMGFDEKTDEWKIDRNYSLAKIFRETYSIQRNSPSALYPDEAIPSFLARKNIVDVSAEYFPVSDVLVKIDRLRGISTKLAYLCVFNNVNWIPVHWGKISGDRVKFTDMGRGMVYLPVLYTAGHKQTVAADPFILDSLGNARYLSPHFAERGTLILERKFHTIRVSEWSRNMLKGHFQTANKSDFSDAVDLYRIEKEPKFIFNTIDLDRETECRYVRYIADSGYCNIAELEFYTKEKEAYQKLSGEIIGMEGMYADKETKEVVFDGDVLTYFSSVQDRDGWVGLDLGEKKRISRIRYLPRNDDNNIRVGDEYELFYWGERRWNSLGKRIAAEEILVYSDCPSGALYLLHNHTRGREERIFTYESGKQVFW